MCEQGLFSSGFWPAARCKPRAGHARRHRRLRVRQNGRQFFGIVAMGYDAVGRCHPNGALRKGEAAPADMRQSEHTKCVAASPGERSHLEPSARPCAGRPGRPRGANEHSEFGVSEIRPSHLPLSAFAAQSLDAATPAPADRRFGLADRAGVTSNSIEAADELFETLQEWNKHLQAEGVLPDNLSRERSPKPRRSRGPSPC